MTREKVIEALSDIRADYNCFNPMEREKYHALSEAIEMLQERKTGKWNFIGDQMFECTKCGTCYTQSQFYQMRVRITDSEFPKFCPNCGADMREGEADES